MLTSRDLKQLANAYHDRQVLTVYLHPAVQDPAERYRWVVEFEQAVRRVVADAPHATHDERETLRAAVGHVRAALGSSDAAWQAAGVLAIADAHEFLHAVPLETPVPTLATWQRGIFVAPLLAEVSTVPPIPLLVVDDRSARRYRFTPPRHLEHLDTRVIRVAADLERHLGSGTSHFHNGTRGGTASEAIERRLRAARERLYGEALVPALAMMATEGWLVIGGPPRAVAAARALVSDAASDRVVVLDGLAADAPPHEIAVAATRALEARLAQQDVLLVRELLEAAAARGRAAVGLIATKAMLDRADVADLVLSEHFVSGHPIDADDLLHRAFHQGARVREVHGRAAEVMDESAEGVMARLRYAVPTPSR